MCPEYGVTPSLRKGMHVLPGQSPSVSVLLQRNRRVLIDHANESAFANGYAQCRAQLIVGAITEWLVNGP